MSRKPTDSSGISFTALYTGAVWHRHGLSDDLLATDTGRWLYRLMTPFETASQALTGGNLRTFLLQRHLILDALIERALDEHGITQVLEIACGLSPRGLRLRQRHPQLHMVEADLPEMAARKAARLAAAGHLDANHQVVPIDILAEAGDRALETVIASVFDNRQPVVVITEGLTSYFSLAAMSDFWRRLQGALSQRPGSIYLTETYYRPSGPLLKMALATLGGALGTLTRSQVSFHFRDDAEAGDHFRRCGFDAVAFHDPRKWYDALPIPRSRAEPLVRIIEARA